MKQVKPSQLWTSKARQRNATRSPANLGVWLNLPLFMSSKQYNSLLGDTFWWILVYNSIFFACRHTIENVQTQLVRLCLQNSLASKHTAISDPHFAYQSVAVENVVDACVVAAAIEEKHPIKPLRQCSFEHRLHLLNLKVTSGIIVLAFSQDKWIWGDKQTWSTASIDLNRSRARIPPS